MSAEWERVNYGTVILDDGSAHPISSIHLAAGLIQVYVPWHTAFVTTTHYRVVGEDGSPIWDALFQLSDEQRAGYQMWSEKSVAVVHVALPIQFISVNMADRSAGSHVGP